ncbi:hypothetical protein C8R43DRAFT_4419 [Mycena crocata]|nr:hypothetical protein C8R43DRAFT_4419 [Mycena crocata]
MTTHSFQILSDQEVIDMKRSHGIMACAECQRRKLKCDRKFPCSSCVRRGRADICPTGDLGFIGRGRRVLRSEVNSTHPFLREELRSIHNSADFPRSTDDPTPAQITDSFGAMALDATDTPLYSSGHSALNSAGADGAQFTSSFAQSDIAQAFPLEGEANWSYDTTFCSETLLGQLPDEFRAWTLYDIFVNQLSWYDVPIMPEELHQLVAQIYAHNLNPYELPPHAVALVFLVFAAAAHAERDSLKCKEEADRYFDLGCKVLALDKNFPLPQRLQLPIPAMATHVYDPEANLKENILSATYSADTLANTASERDWAAFLNSLL